MANIEYITTNSLFYFAISPIFLHFSLKPSELPPLFCKLDFTIRYSKRNRGKIGHENTMTDWYFQLLEEDIKEHPEMWLWTHKRWSRTKEEWLRRQAQK